MEYQFHGMRNVDPIAAIMPPARHEIFFGATLEKSKAGEMKFATMLMPTVAVTKVRPPSRIAKGVSICSTVLIGSVMSAPNTGTVAEAVMTVSSEKNTKLTGRPQKLPFFTAAKLLPYRAKSPKLSIGPEKYDTTSAIAPSITGIEAQKSSWVVERVNEMFWMPACDTR
ncbi:MAG: hypothetical protein K0R81_1796 [Microbacterium sp.]|nr:hypothetical protein [Microbacterium sp.]